MKGDRHQRLSARLVTPEAAWARICRTVRPLQVEPVALAEAAHRYLARPVRADRDSPPTRRAAMDGYAVRAADTPGWLDIAGEIAAGAPPHPDVRPGQCVRIFTGAPVPKSADAVVPVEDCEVVESGRVRVPATSAGCHVLQAGEFTRRGEVVLPAGSRLTAEALAVCAAVGCERPTVQRRPRAAVLATGSELRAISEKLRPWEIRDSNSEMIRAALVAEGCLVIEVSRVPDDRVAIRRRIARWVERCDLLVMSGGVSVGDYDWVPEVLADLGARVHYHGVAMKPGKPQLFATFRKCLLFGLPGNPLSAAVGLHEFVLPAVRLLSGCPTERARPEWRLPLGAPVAVNGSRRRYLPCRFEIQRGFTVVTPLDSPSSGDWLVAARAQGAILVPAGRRSVEGGDLVPVRPWRVL